MSRIEINAGGRQVIIDHEGELEPIARTAFDLWTKAEGPEPRVGPASAGFQMERRGTWDYSPMAAPGAPEQVR